MEQAFDSMWRFRLDDQDGDLMELRFIRDAVKRRHERYANTVYGVR